MSMHIVVQYSLAYLSQTKASVSPRRITLKLIR